MDGQLNLSSTRKHLSDALLAIPAGRVRCIFGATFAEASAALNEAEPEAHAPLGLLVQSTPGQDSGALVEIVIRSLAETALNLWPRWWSTLDFGPSESFDLRVAQMRVHTADLPRAVIRPWAVRAIGLAAEGKLPVVDGISREVQLRQLALAIHSAGLVLGVFVDGPSASDAVLVSLVHACTWMARNADVGVALLSATNLSDHEAVQRVLYGAHAIPALVAPSSLRDDEPGPKPLTKQMKEQRIWLGPVLGRPHPNSPGELKLYDAIQADSELAPLFTFTCMSIQCSLRVRWLIYSGKADASWWRWTATSTTATKRHSQAIGIGITAFWLAAISSCGLSTRTS